MNLVTIHNTRLPVVEYRGQRVASTQMIDQVHERPDGTTRRNFNENRGRFVEGEDYFKVSAEEIRTHKIMPISNRAHEDFTLFTEQGYLMIVKSLTDDLAWTVQRQIVSNYFRPAPVPALPGDYITALEHLLASKRSEQLALEQRDEAVRTKAEIGSRRGATAMATASAAVRQVRHLENQLGRGCQHATVTAGEKGA
ncbi:ORF6N domain-containing protein, partial [Pseudomonas monteilii]|uniref:ORF6N domain-containing protein n=1 Tax=Pseudomonas monteilii TaxID=76759 RepID=UPI0018A842CD